MRRRAFLLTATAGITAGSGCLARAGIGKRVQTPKQVESLSFHITEEGGGPASSPSIAFESAVRQIRITGTMWAGSPCKEAQLKAIDYDAKTDSLTVLVGVGKKPLTFGCPDSLGADTYEILITFDSRLPNTVTATHRDFQGETATSTARFSE